MATRPLSRVAALYDIHGNLPALEAVLEDVRRSEVDQIIVGGDLFPGPMPRETLACLVDLDIPPLFIHGNDDREVLAQIRGTESTWFHNAPDALRALLLGQNAQLRVTHYDPACGYAVWRMRSAALRSASPARDRDASAVCAS
jgi:predicted phosphodiesterase